MNILFLDSSTEKLLGSIFKVKESVLNKNSTDNIKIDNFRNFKVSDKNNFYEFYHVEINAGYKHTENIYEVVNSIFKLSSIENIDQIDYVLLGAGPGSFTGVRIAYAFVKGLFCNKNIKIVQVPSIFIKFISFFIENSFIYENDIIIPLIFGKKNRFYGMMEAPKIVIDVFNKKDKVNLIKDFFYFDFEIKNIFVLLKEKIDKFYIENIRVFFDNELLKDQKFEENFCELKKEFFISEEKKVQIFDTFFKYDLEKFFIFILKYIQKIEYNDITNIDPFYLREPDAYENLKKEF